MPRRRGTCWFRASPTTSRSPPVTCASVPARRSLSRASRNRGGSIEWRGAEGRSGPLTTSLFPSSQRSDPVTTSVTDLHSLDEEQRDDRFTDLVRRLSHKSVAKHFDAYADVDWDHPDNVIDATDRNWELTADSPLGGTEWYRSLPAETRARIGLHTITSNMKAGLQFESVLK